MKLSFLFLFCFVNSTAFAQLLQKQHVPRQPYHQYTIPAEQGLDSVTFYLSGFQADQKLPLLVFIQGSGNRSLFRDLVWDRELTDKNFRFLIRKVELRNFCHQLCYTGEAIRRYDTAIQQSQRIIDMVNEEYGKEQEKDSPVQ